jgi:mannose-6-phosphate isomerase
MTAIARQPLRFEPILRRLIWGGRRLGTVLGKPIGEAADYAESWEISDYKDAVSVVCEGPLAGTTLRELVRSQPEALMGRQLANRRQFPLLVKFIDARETLSVQVHPDDEKGRRLANDNGKTETWVIVDGEPGSLIYAGLKPGVTRDQFAAAIEAGSVEPLLHRFTPRPGDCILIEAGTVHAIGSGVLLAEIQQMSDATFRVDDWGRVGPDGKPRELHVAQALESTDFTRGPVDPLGPWPLPAEQGNHRDGLPWTPYFALERWTLTRPQVLGDASRFTILMGLSGSAQVGHEPGRCRLEFGQTLLLPAALGPCPVEPEGEAMILTCVVP